MKRIILTLLALSSFSHLHAQLQAAGDGWDFSLLTDSVSEQSQLPNTLEGWKRNLEHFGTTIPQEEVFLHMDNTCYFAGDTLYFKAYVRRSDTGRPTNLSRLLYAELWNQEGYLQQRHLIRLTNGQGYGSFVLPDSLYGGFYELRAYTRWQLNWGEYQHMHTWPAEEYFLTRKMAKEYFRDYEKLYSRIFPLYDKPKEPGEFDHNMTTRPKQRYFRTETKRPSPRATLYPEGGVLVAGTHARVAFEANERDGEHISGTMYVTNRKGDTVAKAHTENRGRGILEFDYEKGESYHAHFESDSGRVIRVKVPYAETDGCAVRTDIVGQQLRLTLQPRGTAAQETLGVTVMTGGALHFFRKFRATDTEFFIPTDSLPTGVAQVTVYNADGRVYSDRLVFIRHKQDVERTQVEFDGVSNMYRPFEKIDVAVSNPNAAGSTISLAVRDAAYSEYLYDSSNMLTEMLLCSQIKGFVEQPDYYFEKDDDEHRRHLDLLLLVQGWRRHNWLTMATPGIFHINHPIEDTPVFFGTVNRYFAPGREGLFGWGNEAYNWREDQDFDLQLGRGRTESFFRHRGSPSGVSVPTLGTADYARDLHNTYSYRLREKDSTHYYAPGYLKHEVRVHVEVTKPTVEGLSNMVGEVETRNGQFILQMPSFYGECILNLAASDTTKWKGAERRRRWIDKIFHWRLRKSKLKPSYEHLWVVPNNTEYPEFYVRLTPYYPRFVKPFNFYHTHVAPFREGTMLAPSLKDTKTLAEVKVHARHGGLRKFSTDHPALVVDAYRAFNECADAGFTPGWFTGPSYLMSWVSRLYVADMNDFRHYRNGPGYSGSLGNITPSFSSRIDSYLSPFSSGEPVERIDFSHFTDDLRFGGINDIWWPETRGKYYAPYSEESLRRYDMGNYKNVRLITDYEPRREGDRHYMGADQPTVNVAFEYLDDEVRPTYRDRHYVMQGYSICEEFYQPNYSQRPLPDLKDYRRTLYWNPNLQLDEKGEAKVSFWNNCRTTAITLSAEGLAEDGQIITGISYPEDR